MSQAPGPDTPSKRTRFSKPAAAKAVSLDEAAPPCFIRKLRKAAVGTGCDIRLRVSVLGNPEPELSWYRNEELLPPGEAQDSGGLWIRDCRTSDAGLYTCVAANNLGEASSSAVLAVMDLGEDSETTEDEATEPQGPMETKAGPGRPQGTFKGPPGEEGGRVGAAMGGEDHRRTAALPGGFDPIVERELRALGSRPPGSTASSAAAAAAAAATTSASTNHTHLDPSHPARQAPLARGCLPPVRHLGVEPLMRASHANLALPAQGSEESVCVGSDYYGSMFSLYRGRTFSMPL